MFPVYKNNSKNWCNGVIIEKNKSYKFKEAFWRIPAKLEGTDLQHLIDGLTINDDGDPVNTHMIKVHQPKLREKKTKDKQKIQKEKKKKKQEEENNESRKEEKQKKAQKKMDIFKALAEKRKTKRGEARR